MPFGANDPGKERSASGGDRKPDPHELPLFELLREVDPNIQRMFEDLLNYTIFSERPLALDLKTRYLVLVGITTAVRGDREGIEWSSQLAMKYGATEREVVEAISLANLPAGTPSIEYAAAVWDQMRSGGSTVQAHGTAEEGRSLHAWEAWQRR
jgi:alkylhydroperoxidase/carboxymuconolactone decarboxylase family protein YurZ